MKFSFVLAAVLVGFLVGIDETFADSVKRSAGLKIPRSKELKTMSKTARTEFINRFRSALVQAESSQARNGGFAAFKWLEPILWQYANAQEAQSDICVYAGHISKMVDMNGVKRCQRPPSPGCPTGTVLCNPVIFGPYLAAALSTDERYCVNAGNNATRDCKKRSEKDLSSISFGMALEKDRTVAEKWDAEAAQLEAYCNDPKTRLKGFTETCQLLEAQLADFRAWKMKSQDDKQMDDDPNCGRFPKVLKSSYYTSPTRLPQTYVINKSADNSYQADVKIRFKGKNLTAYANSCLTKFDDKLLGPNGEKLKVRINEEGSAMAPAVDVKVSNTQRANASNWSSNIDCETVLHETLHLLGLVDEYQEEWSGYKSKTVNGRTEYQKVENESDPTLRDYDCRFLGPHDSVMSHQWEAANRSGSMLMPAQFNSIVFPECTKKNMLYNRCARFAYATSPYDKRNEALSIRCQAQEVEKTQSAFAACTSAGNQDWLSGRAVTDAEMQEFARPVDTPASQNPASAVQEGNQ